MPRPIATRWKPFRTALPCGVALALCVATHPVPVRAAEFAISPISLQFGPGQRAGVITIRNADQRPIRFQLSLVAWTQDAQGSDVYTPSDDLIFFPRQLTVAPGDKNIARLGPKRDASGAEKSYRLRIEELPEPVPESLGSAINISVTFAIPIFLGKTDTSPALTIAPLQMQDGKVTVTVSNTGQSHFRIGTLELSGANGYAQEMGGWYLLSGASRQYTLTVAPEVCRAQRQLRLKVNVGEQAFTSDFTVDPLQCGT